MTKQAKQRGRKQPNCGGKKLNGSFGSISLKWMNARHGSEGDKARQPWMSIHETTKSNTCQAINKNPSGIQQQQPTGAWKETTSTKHWILLGWCVWRDLYVKITCLITVRHSSIPNFTNKHAKTFVFFIWCAVHFSISAFLFIAHTAYRMICWRILLFYMLISMFPMFYFRQNHFMHFFLTTIPLICWFHIFIGMVPPSIQNDSIAWQIIQLTIFSYSVMRFIRSFRIYIYANGS